MRFAKDRGYRWGMIVVCLLAFSVCSQGGMKDTTDACEVWRNFGTLLLYRLVRTLPGGTAYAQPVRTKSIPASASALSTAASRRRP